MSFEKSKEDGAHQRLAALVGEWEGPTKTWFEPDVLADESLMSGKMSAILGGRFILHEYSGQMMGKPFEGVAIYGFDLATNKFQAAWVDSFHMSTGILFSEGEPGDRFSVLGSYDAGGPEVPRWGWRTEIDVIGDDNIVVTAYNISPEGDEAMATETRYTRKN
jgi:hypothetical protein